MRPLYERRATRGQFLTLVRELNLDDEQHVNYFRMTRSRFNDLLRRVGPLITHPRTHRHPLEPAERLAITLRLLASGDSQASMSFNYRVSRASISLIFRETCKELWEVLKTEFVAPPTEDAFASIAQDFWELWHFPNCLGAIDGKHVAIVAPPKSGSLYHNYKQFFSVVLMAIVDARYRFMFIDVGAYGRNSDGGTFSNSTFGKAILEGSLPAPGAANLPNSDISNPHVFVADEAFPLRSTIMRPYLGRDLTKEKKIFNYRLSRARRCVENAFGILSSRWRIFQRPKIFLRATDSQELSAHECAPTSLIDREDSSLRG